MMETVLVLGASPKPGRHSFNAVQLLREYGHRVLPVNPYHAEVSGVECIASIAAVCEKVDTMTLYIRTELLKNGIDPLIALAPRRVIFNPGTESDEMAAKLESAGIAVAEACT
jgi:predicted CoA-binding protein